jgi:hypothetical protein
MATDDDIIHCMHFACRITKARIQMATDDDIIHCMHFACRITKARIQMHTQDDDDGYVNVPRCYSVHSLPVLLNAKPGGT